MALDIVVCLKQVPHPEHFSQIALDPVRQTIIREGIPTITNPLDKNALEEGLSLRERFSGKVRVVSMGPPQAREALEEALAMGADEAVLLSAPAFAGADSLATAYTLAQGIKTLGPFDLILCGNDTVDGATAQVGPQLAEFLDIPHVTYATMIGFVEGRALIVERALEQGHMKVKVALPALIAVTGAINHPRLATVWGITEAVGKEIKVWGPADIGADPAAIGIEGSAIQVKGIFAHEAKRKGKILEGPPQEVARRALERLRELEAI